MSTENINWQTKILARTVRWDWCGIFQIHILDENEQPYLVLNERQTFVFHEAHGNNTIDEIIAFYPKNFLDKKKLPKSYKAPLRQAAKELIFEHKIIELWTRSYSLPEVLDFSKTEYDKFNSKFYKLIVFKESCIALGDLIKKKIFKP